MMPQESKSKESVVAPVAGRQGLNMEDNRSQATQSIQSRLSPEDLHAFKEWIADHEIKLKPAMLGSILQQAESLRGAKQMATKEHVEGQSVLRATLFEKSKANLEKGAGAMTGAELEETRKEIEVLRIAIEVLVQVPHERLRLMLNQTAHDLGHTLLSTYPPENYTYVFLGNSPMPLYIWLKAHHIPQILHMPLGGFVNPDQDKVKGNHEALNRQRALIKNYMNHYLEPGLGWGKPFVLVDYVSSGESLVESAKAIESWMADHKKVLEILFYAYSEHELEKIPLLNDSKYGGTLMTSVGTMERAFTKLNGAKLFKKVLLLKAAESLDIADLMGAHPEKAVLTHPEFYLRLIHAMGYVLDAASGEITEDK
jgi:hypothetical protein